MKKVFSAVVVIISIWFIGTCALSVRDTINNVSTKVQQASAAAQAN